MLGSMTRWLDVEVGADDIELNSLPSHVVLADLQNDNDYKLLIADLGRPEDASKLKIFKGTTQMADVVLPDLPLGIVSFYTKETAPWTIPVIAVAFSSCIYVYRNLKLFYKYYLPLAELNTCEIQIWKQLIDIKNHSSEIISALSENLNALPYQYLSNQSRQFQSLTLDQKLEYLDQQLESNRSQLPLQKSPEIACIGTLRLNSVDKYSVSCLVVSTEDGDVIVLDPQSFTQLHQAKLCEVRRTPYQMVITGLYTGDYRITVATREKSVCLLKRDWSEGRVLFNTDEHIIAIEVMNTDHSILVICTDHSFACYTKKGRKQWTLTLEHRPVALTLLPILHLGLVLVGVGLASGHVTFYDGKAPVDCMFVRDVVSVMKFGQLGQEEHVLVIITSNGNLLLKILKRTAEFNAQVAGVELPLSPATGPHSRPWLIPKKSKLFLEQSMRERENAVAMHELFQQELNRLRLTAAKTLLEAYNKSDNSVGVGAMEPVRLSAEVEGLGPMFRVTLLIHNTSSQKAVIGLSVLFHVHNTSYKVYKPYIKVPLLSPGSQLKFPTNIEEMFESNINPDVIFRSVTGQCGDRSLVKILLLKEGRARPVLAATVQMPPTDPMMLPFDKLEGTAGFGNLQ